MRGTRRLASGLAIALVLLTIITVYYGPSLSTSSSTYVPSWAKEYSTSPSTGGSSLDDKTGGSFLGDKTGGSLGDKTSGSSLGDKTGGSSLADKTGGSLPSDKADGAVVVNPEPIHNVNPEPGLINPIHSKPTTTPDSGSALSPSSQTIIATKFVADTHREIYSNSTADGKYFLVDFSPWRAYNPNFVPHPFKNDTWITVAQTHKTQQENQIWFTQLVCEAKLQKGKMTCTHPPLTVPIPPTWSSKCEGELAHFNLNIGPHDARVFFGPDKPYILYGTQSAFNCFGQLMQDFTLVSDWPGARPGLFRVPTEIQRPPPYHYERVEKNWFLFWDMQGQIYAHHDTFPKRVFGLMNNDGSVDKDLAPLVSATDDVCLQKRMPTVKPTIDESIHQATNSLAVTMCKRSDPTCVVTESNTFVFTIFHWKSFYEFHGLYEPYVMLFKQAPPFEIYAITSKPLWIHGRRLPGEWREKGQHGWNQTEMIYTTSIAWKNQGQRYHGYLDDPLFLGFGVEDKETAGMDVSAAAILQDIELCDEKAQKPSLVL